MAQELQNKFSTAKQINFYDSKPKFSKIIVNKNE